MTADREWADHRIRSFIGPGPFVPLSVYGDIAALLAERDQLRTELAEVEREFCLASGDRDELLAEVERLRAQVQAAERLIDEITQGEHAIEGNGSMDFGRGMAHTAGLFAAAFVPTDPDMRGYLMWFDRESWGHIIDGLIAAREDAIKRKTANPDSTSDVRADEIGKLLGLIGAAALVPTNPEPADLPRPMKVKCQHGNSGPHEWSTSFHGLQRCPGPDLTQLDATP